MQYKKKLSFRQWLTENGYYQPEKAWELLADKGVNEEELAKLDEEYSVLEKKYWDECHELGYQTCFD